MYLAWHPVNGRDDLNLASPAGRACSAGVLRSNATTRLFELVAPLAVHAIVRRRGVAARFEDYELLLEARVKPDLLASYDG